MAQQTRHSDNELWPLTLGHGPKLLAVKGHLKMSLGSSNTLDCAIGDGQGDAATIVAYTSRIADDSPDALTMAGRQVMGYLLLDGHGVLVARLASDDEPVYDRPAVERFAKTVGIAFADWGDVPSSRIDALMKANRPGGAPKALGATRREWILFAAIAGGFLATWPWVSHLPFSSSRTESYAIFALGVSGFIVGGLGLAIGRFAGRFDDRSVLTIGLTLAAALAAASLCAGALDWRLWSLTPQQTGASLLGLAIVTAVQPWWARTSRR